MREYAVKVETKKGEIIVLQRGFKTRSDAEDMTVRHSEWKRVWVDRMLAENGIEARLPWRVEWGQGKRATYLMDANGNRLASIMGSAETKENFANALADLMSSYIRTKRIAAEQGKGKPDD